MANYLMPDTGQAAAPVSGGGSRGDFISINKMYQMRIYNSSGTIQFTGYTPPDFSMSLSLSLIHI